MSKLPTLNKDIFFERLNKLYSSWKENEEAGYWENVDAFCVLAGKNNPEDSSYRKSAVIQMYLMGYLEFPETIMVFTKTILYVLTGGKKYGLMENIQDGNKTSSVKLELLKRNSGDGNKANYEKLIEAIKASGSGKKVGMLPKETPIGDLVEGFKSAIQAQDFETADVSKGLESAICLKDDSELENIRWAGALSSKVYKLKFLEDMETIIDEEKSVRHDKLSGDVESVFEDPSKIKLSLSPEDIEPCYSPIVQSGGQYDLRPSAQSNQDIMKYDVIMCSLGARFKGYCSNVARTFFIDPTKSMERNYETLREAHDYCIESLRPGSTVKNVVDKVRRRIEEKNPKLLPRLTKNLGFGIGLEFRESINLLSAKNNTEIKPGMAFNVAFGFDNIPTGSQKKANQPENYSIFLADTVVVLAEETKVYTKVSKAWSKVHYDIDDSSEEKEKKVDEKKKIDSSIHGSVDTSVSGTRSQLLQSRLRDQQRQLVGKETDQEKREKHQAELMKRKREEAIRRLSEKGNDESTSESQEKSMIAYRSPANYPSNLKDRQIFVDMQAEAVILPVNGFPIPFHISAIKSVSKSEEDKATYLRINFYTPGQTLGKDISPAMQTEITKNGTKMFIKELGFRSIEAHNLNIQYRLIKELQKRVKQKQQQLQEESDLVIQEDLILIRDRKVPRLSDLSFKPHISGRKCQGTLEAHVNGLRFTSIKNEKVDILYSNMKHAIFQPCDRELSVLIHFHLKNPIMIGKKKQTDVQCFTEVMDASQALDNRRRSMYDPDELDEENRERQLRSKLNQTFKEFCRKVESTAEKSTYPVSFDIPYRELGFQGSPFKEMVMLQPTVNCLVNLTESPFFIVSLNDIEHVHFERVMFSSKNFDLVIVVKDFKVLPQRISAISMTELDSIKEWLDDIDICYTEGTANLNWKNIMETIRNDDRFYLDTDEDGVPKSAGWEFLKMDGSDDDDDGEEEDEDSNFSDEVDDEEDQESSEDDDSDLSSLVDEDESEEDEEEEEDAPTWDELEEEAVLADNKRIIDAGDSSPRKKKRSRH